MITVKSHRLAIINGLFWGSRNKNIKSSIAHYFEEIIISEAINLSKPNPEIFSYALNKMNHNDKKSVLMIGDSLTSDIKGGINFGIDTCWYNQTKSAILWIFTYLWNQRFRFNLWYYITESNKVSR